MKLTHKTNTENSEFKLLFSTTNLSPMVKLAIISIDSNTIPKFMAFAAFILSQFQLLSLFLKSGLMCFSNKSLTLFKSFSSIHDAISIGGSLDFNNSFTLAIIIIAIAYIYLVFGMFLLMYLLRNMYQEKIHSKVLQKIWGIGAYLHILVFFYPINAISLKVISVSFAKDDRQVFHTEQAWTFMEVSSCLAFIINSLLSTIILIYLLPPVKAGFSLASKTKKLSIMDIALKFLLPFLWMLDFQSESFNIFITIFNLIFCLLKDFIFFRTLPFYNMMALRIAARVYASLTLFALAVVISVSLSYADLGENLLFIGILWLLIGPSAVKVYSTYLESIFDKILFFASSNTNSYYLAQYWYIFKDKARKRGCLELEARKFNKGHFRLITFLDKIMHTSIDMAEREEYLQIKDMIYSKKEGIFESANYVLNLGIGFLKNSVRKYPLAVLPKVALASHYIKYHHSYQTASYVIYQGLNKSSSFTKTISFSLVLLKIIRKLHLDKAGTSKSGDKNISKGSLSIELYLSMHQQFEKIKGDIKHQLEPQIKFWKNFQLANTDLDSFISLARLTHQRSTRVFRYIKNHQVFVGSNFVEPLLTLGLYLSFVQNDSASGGKMMKEYDLWSTKPKNNTKNASTMMNNGSVYFVVSASFHDIGKILNYSKSANQMLSLHKESVMGKSINLFAPSIYGKDNEHILGVSLKEDISASFEKPRELPILDREGKLHLCWVNITLEFLPKAGLSYCILLRPTDVPYRMVLIKQNGLIMHSSGRFEKDMGIKTTEKKSMSNIFSFCQQLSILVRAFQHRQQQSYLPPKKEKIEKRTSNGSEIVYSVGEIEQKDELKNTLADKDGEYYRLHEKYRTGETLIFYPHSKQKGDSSPISIVSDSKAGVFTRPIAYKTIIEAHHIGNENIFKIKLKEEIGANLDLVWANLDPVLKIHDTQKYMTYPEIEHTLKSLKSKGMSPLLTKNSRLSSHLAILGAEASTEDKLERLKSNLTCKSNNTPPNSCDLRESDREIIINEPIQRSLAEGNMKKLEVKKSEKEEEVIDEDLKMKIIRLGLVKKENKAAEKWLETMEHAQRHRGSFKVGSDRADFKDCNIRKMVNQMHNNNQNQLIIEESTSVSSRSRTVRSEKTLQKILRSRNASKTTICYIFYVLFTALGMLAVVLWFSFNGSDISQRVKTVSEALQNIYMRCFWTNLAHQETRIWSGVRGGIVDPNWSEGFIDIAIETRTTNTTFHKMDQFNNQLYQAIASMDDETQLLFATKNVRIYDRDDNNNLVLIGIENTFQTTSRILTEGFINVYMPYSTEIIEDFITSEARFIFDNSHNDLLIVSENLIQVLTDKMDSTFSNIESLNLGILWAGIAAAVVLVAVTVTYIIKINREYHIFANVLFTLSQEDALRTESILVAFHDMLEKDYEGFDWIEALEAAQTNPHVKAVKQDSSNHMKKGIQVNSSKSIQKVSITNLKKKNFFLFIKMLFVMACIVAALLFYYFWSLQRIHTMETQQNIINSSLDYIKLQSMISVELQSLAQDNDTSYIRNQPLLTSLNNDMERLAQISELENAFRDTSGQLPALQLEILSGYNCDDVTTDLYLLSPGSAEEECADLAAGTNVIGLVEVITKMQFQMTVFLEQFFSSPRDTDELKALYLDVINDFIEFLDVSITMFLMSYSFTLVEFQELVDELTSGGYILAAVGVIIACLIGIWSWLTIIRPLTSKEFDRKRVLSMMPALMLLSNKHIKAYVVRNISDGAREARHLLK